jgi:colicin import membrane protein
MKLFKIVGAKAGFGPGETIGLTEAQADLRAGKLKLKKDGTVRALYEVAGGETVEFKKGELLLADENQPRGRAALFDDPTDEDIEAAEKNDAAYAERKKRSAEKEANHRKAQKKAAADRAEKKRAFAEAEQKKAAESAAHKLKLQAEADEKAAALAKQVQADAEQLDADAKARAAEAAANGETPEKPGLFKRIMGQ